MEHDYRYEYYGVRIRPMTHEDIELLRTWRNNTQNSQYLRKIPHITAEMQEKWYSSYLEDKNIIMFMIDIDDPTPKTVGSISLYHLDGEDSLELGKVLIGDADSHNKSIGTRAVIAATSVAIEQLSKNKVYLHVNKKNFAAVKTYKRAGFVVGESFSEDEVVMKYMGQNGKEGN